MLKTILLCGVWGAASPALGADWLYWADSSATPGLQRAALENPAPEELVSGLVQPRGLALDPAGGKVYWADASPSRNRIERANLDGTDVEAFLTGLDNPRSLALDPGAGWLYWTELGTGSGVGAVRRADLEGSAIEDLVTGAGTRPFGLALDLDAGKVYWTDGATARIRRADLNGQNVEDLISSGLTLPRFLALDVPGGKMYWTHANPPKLQRANLDGSGVEDLAPAVGLPFGVVLDPVRGKVYWADGATFIRRANLDGTGVEDFLSGLDGPTDLALLRDALPPSVPSLTRPWLLALAVGMGAAAAWRLRGRAS
jgi:low density lipoprotein receptor-related protein 5/6